MAEPIVSMTARVTVDKDESFREVVKAIEDIQSYADKNQIVYTLKADEDSLEKTLKEIANRDDLQLGVDIVIKSNAKQLQNQIDKLFSGAQGLTVTPDIKITPETTRRLKALQKEFQNIYSEGGKSLSDSGLGINWSKDEEGSLKRIAERLKEIYSLRKSADFEKKYGNEVVALMDVAAGAGYSDFVTEDGVRLLSKNVQEYFNNTKRFVEARQTLEQYAKLDIKEDTDVATYIESIIQAQQKEADSATKASNAEEKLNEERKESSSEKAADQATENADAMEKEAEAAKEDRVEQEKLNEERKQSSSTQSSETANKNADALEREAKEAKKAKDAVDDLNLAWIRRQSGDKGDDDYVKALNKVEDLRIRSYTDENGNPQQIETRFINLDKLAKEIKNTDTEILDLEYKIKHAQGDTSGLQENLGILKQNRDVYEKILDDVIASPIYEADSSQKGILTAQRAINEEIIRNKQLTRESALAEKEKAKAIKESLKEQKQKAATTASVEPKVQIETETLDKLEEKIKNNSNLAAQFGGRISELRNLLGSVDDSSGFQYVDKEVRNLTQSIEEEIGAMEKAAKAREKFNQAEQAYEESINKAYEEALKEDDQRARQKIVDQYAAEDLEYLDKRNKYLEEGKRLQEAEQTAYKKRVKEYENIFFGNDGKIKAPEIAVDTEALKQSNALYDQLETKIKEIYELKQAGAKEDSSTQVGQDRIRRNNEQIAELSREALAIQREINEAEAVQETRERQLLSIHEDRNAVLKQIANEQELESRDSMTSQADKWLKQIDSLQKSKKYTKEFEDELDKARKAIEAFDSSKGSIDEVNNSFEELNKTMNEINSNKGLSEFKKAQEVSIAKLNLRIDEFIQKNSKMGREFKERFENLKLDFDTSQSEEKIKRVVTEFAKLNLEVIAAGKTGSSYFEMLRERAMGVNAQLIAQYLSWQDIIRYLRTAASTVIDLNSALTEMRKVSDESLASLKQYQGLTFDIAGDVGTTALDLQKSTADWMRLGEAMEDAAESAKASTILLNVSEFESIDEATQSLVSASQAFKELDKMEIIDVLNNVGKRNAETYGNIWGYLIA